MKSLRCLFIFFLLLIRPAVADSQDSLPTIKPEDARRWQNLQSAAISPDGNWVAWQVSPVEGDDTLYIKHVPSGICHTYALASNIVFSNDSKWAAMSIGYSEEVLEKMREKKEEIRYKLKLVNLSTDNTQTFENIQKFGFSENSSHLAMGTYGKKEDKHKGKDLILHNLITGGTRNIGNVSEWGFNKKGDLLAYIVDADGKQGNGVELFRLDNYTVTLLASDTTSFCKLAWERKENALAFLQAYYDSAYLEPGHRIYAFTDINKPEPRVFDPEKIPGFPDSMRIKDSYTPFWSEDLTLLFYGIDYWKKKDNVTDKKEGTNEKQEIKPKKEKLPGVDVWHWKDDPIQPRQQKTYQQDKNFTFLCAWMPAKPGFRQITGEKTRDGILTGDQKHTLVWDKKSYQPQFREELADYYIVDNITGEKTKILPAHIITDMMYPSPDGKYILYFRDGHWWTYDIRGGKHNNLTANIPVDFRNIRYDGPREPIPPVGAASWMKEDQEVYLYDDFDVWAVKGDGSAFRQVTFGRKDSTIYREIRISREEPYLDPKEPLYFSMFSDKNKKSGFARQVPKGKTEILIFDNYSFRRFSKAKSADKFIYSKESYTESPDIYITGTDFRSHQLLSHTNLQQKNFAWGKAELIHFKNKDGKALQGVLHYPAGYVPGRQYPMLVYIYEIRSNSLHNYIVPSPRSPYNITNFSQSGFFVFQPDIVYKTNYPGESAVECVVPGIEKVMASGMIDRKRIGLMGHSWGAYQTAFIVSQTDLFSAAVAGAPLTNMISMYNSIYWNSGQPDQQIFETSQGRLREPYWQILENYIANSPVFQAQRINTPLLVAFGDQDGAVDWNQGVEFYITLRRLQKPVIMLVYAGENHGLAKKENQLDYTLKINEFFNHFLLNKSPAAWITEGVPYLKKKEAEDLKK